MQLLLSPSQVLYVELKLPPSGDPSAPGATTKTLGPARRSARGRAKPAHSTNKDVLEKLKKLHPLPGVSSDGGYRSL